MRQSRLSRNLERQSKRQVITTGVAIIIIIFAFIQFGPYLIDKIGTLFGTFKKESPEVIRAKIFLAPPTLNDIPPGSGTDTITVSGQTSEPTITVQLFVNDNLYKETESRDGKFEFKDVKLSVGDNTIKARVKNDKTTSDFSKEFTVTYSKEPPKLDVTFPSDGQTFQKADQEINVTGKTDPASTITVNGFTAIVRSDGAFSYYLKLNEGDNTIKIEAKNAAGNTTDKEIKVKYQP